jgi:hypothetical protein
MKSTTISRISFLAVIMLAGLGISACGNSAFRGDPVKESRDVTGFTKINLSISGDLHLKQGNKYEVVLEGDKESLDKIETEVSGKSLNIKIKSVMHWGNIGKVDIYITTPNVDAISVSGSGDVMAETPINSGDLNLTISGSGTINIDNLSADELDATITGSGNMKLSGKLNNSADITITGSGDYKGEQLKGKSADIHITGSGSAKVYASEKLKTHITGSGDVYYAGRPLVNASSTGSGKTRSIE